MAKKPRYRKDRDGKITEVKREILKDTLDRLLKFDPNLRVSGARENTKLKDKWKKIIGDKLASLTSVKDNGKGGLVIEAGNSVIIQELKMHGENYFIKEFKSGDDIFIFNKVSFKVKR